jgi:hypothetical protein
MATISKYVVAIGTLILLAPGSVAFGNEDDMRITIADLIREKSERSSSNGGRKIPLSETKVWEWRQQSKNATFDGMKVESDIAETYVFGSVVGLGVYILDFSEDYCGAFIGTADYEDGSWIDTTLPDDAEDGEKTKICYDGETCKINYDVIAGRC